jgi:FkbM family methyltransferase
MIFNTKDQYVGRSFDVYGEYSEGEVEIFRFLINPGETVLDIGANIGALTIPLSRIVGRHGKVVAFEAQHLMYYVLCGNVAINNLMNVDCWLMAVGEKRGSIDVPVVDTSSEGNFGSLSLKQTYEGVIHTKSVPMVTVDSATLTSCNFIKIDVEGMEADVIKGATETIKKHKPVLCVEDDRSDNREVLHELIKSLGYRIIGHRPLLFNPNNLNEVARNVFIDDEEKPFASYNLICLPEGDPRYQKIIDSKLFRIKEY